VSELIELVLAFDRWLLMREEWDDLLFPPLPSSAFLWELSEFAALY